MTPVKEDEAEGKGWQFFRNGLAAILAHTPHLQVLTCYDLNSFLVPQESLYILKQLSSLQSLCLGLQSSGNWQVATLDELSHLTSLHTLGIHVSNMRSDPLFLAPGLTNLLALTSLTLRRRVSYLLHGDMADDATSMPNLIGVVTRLSSLVTLELAGVVDSIPEDFTSLQLLKELVVRDFDMDGPAFSISPAFVACSTLQSLSLAGLSRASGPALPLICSLVSQLRSLRHLEVHSYMSVVDAAACSFSPHLTRLELSCCLRMLPPCILSMTSLETLLYYERNGASHGVPPIGPYLQNLRSLRLWAVPADVSTPFLLAAARLTDLSLASDEDQIESADEDQFESADEDVQRILRHTPAACYVSINDACWGPA